MQTPDSCSAADRTGEASARGHGVGGGSRPSLPVVGMSGKRTAMDTSLSPRGVPCLPLPQHHFRKGADSGQR